MLEILEELKNISALLRQLSEKIDVIPSRIGREVSEAEANRLEHIRHFGRD